MSQRRAKREMLTSVCPMRLSPTQTRQVLASATQMSLRREGTAASKQMLKNGRWAAACVGPKVSCCGGAGLSDVGDDPVELVTGLED